MKQLFKDRICAVVAGSQLASVKAQLRRALRLTSTIELRLDYLAPPDRARLLAGLHRNKRVSWIATCRLREAGGKARGRRGSEIADLAAATRSGCQWCDLSVETADSLSHPKVRSLLGQAHVMVSFHDFRGAKAATARKVARRFRRSFDATKVAVHCRSIRDSVRLLDLCRGRLDVVAVPMGEIGLPARVLALQRGSALAYAAVEEKTAPGQLTLDEMKQLYRVDKLNAQSGVYGVIGNPVGHSLSPVLHNSGFIARRMNHVYLPFLVRHLSDFLDAIEPLRIRGFSVTIPHKQRILRYLDECDPLAAAIGSVNTVVVRRNGRLYGLNTDYVGVLRALQRRVRLRGSRVLICGAGGVARAVAFALAHEGAVPAICARRPLQARQLARAVQGEVLPRSALRDEYFDAIVNCTPVGMHPHTGASPLDAHELNCRLVFDTVYRPMRTTLLTLAERRGIETVSGVEMFLAQGIAQWEIWMQQRAPEREMRSAVMKVLRREPMER